MAVNFGIPEVSEYHAKKIGYLGVEVKDYTPAPFQVADLAKLKALGPASANFSEMGCYKTTTALWHIEQMLGTFEGKHILIVTTKTGKIPYYNMAPSIARDIPIYNLDTKGALEQDFSKPGIYLTHYNVFMNARKKDWPDGRKPANPIPSKATQKFIDTEWDFVLLDEGHRIKSMDTQWTKWLKKLDAKNRHIMTGNGFINRPSEIWSLLNFILPEKFRSFWAFKQAWSVMEQDWYGYWHEVGVRNPTRFREMISRYSVRRTKAEVFKDLPERYITRIPVELTPTQRRMYNQIKSSMETVDIKGQMLPTPAVLSQLTRMRQIAVGTPEVVYDEYDNKQYRRVIKVALREPSAKIDAMMEIVEGTDEKIVIFSQFVDGIKLAKARLDKAGIPYIHMEQRDSEAIRMAKVAAFQSNPEKRIFLSTLALGSESITLTAASAVIFLDRSWSPKDNEQAIARVHRPGQTLPTQIIMIEANDTVDQRLEEKLTEKWSWFQAVFG